MPRNTREWSKRELQRALGNIDWVGTHINKVADVYSDEHPEIAAPLYLSLQILEELQKAVEKVKDSY